MPTARNRNSARRSIGAWSENLPDDDQNYLSENTSSGVRRSLFDSWPKVAIPRHIQRSALQDWTVVPAEPLDRLIRALGRDTWVVGRVHSVHIPAGGSPVIFNIGPDHRNCFQCVIFDRELTQWGVTAQEVAGAYEGKDVVVGGPISLFRDRPQIVITIESQILMIVE